MRVPAFQLATQNLTQGNLTHAILNSQVAVLQEINKRTVIEAANDHKLGCWIADRDRHQAILWDPRFLSVKRMGYSPFHKSGKAEGFGFPTPARGMIWIRGEIIGNRQVKADDVEFAAFGLWFLNSWNPMKTDEDTKERKQIVQERSIPVVRQRVKKWQDNGVVVVGGGDANSIKWSGFLNHKLEQPWDRGLDRVWYDKRLELRSKREGPVVGVGEDMKHASRIARLEAA